MSDTAKLKKPDFVSDPTAKTGHVTHDDRGDAVWQWSPDVDVAAVTGRHKFPTDPFPDAELAVERRSDRKPGDPGYDPYASGGAGRKRRRAKRDLRALSAEIESTKKTDESDAS